MHSRTAAMCEIPLLQNAQDTLISEHTDVLRQNMKMKERLEIIGKVDGVVPYGWVWRFNYTKKQADAQYLSVKSIRFFFILGLG